MNALYPSSDLKKSHEKVMEKILLIGKSWKKAKSGKPVGSHGSGVGGSDQCENCLGPLGSYMEGDR